MINRRTLIVTSASLVAAASLLKAQGDLTVNPKLTLAGFASDFSGNDQLLVEMVRGFAQRPPADVDVIGFHGADQASPQTRAWLAAVSALRQAGHIHSFEDKYAGEALAFWEKRGWVTLDALAQPARDILSALRDYDGNDDGDSDPKAMQSFRKQLWTNYANAMGALEQEFRRGGKELVSLDATGGDTMFFAVVSADVAASWKGKTFNPAVAGATNYEGGIRPPMWDRYWEHLGYALGPIAESPDRGDDYPPGTLRRARLVPVALT